MSSKVIVTHSHRDAERVRPIVEALAEFALEMVVPTSGPGEAVVDGLRDAFEEADAHVVFVATELSGWITFEVGMAAALKKPVIIVRMDGGSAGLDAIVNPALARYVDGSRSDARTLARKIAVLVEDIRAAQLVHA